MTHCPLSDNQNQIRSLHRPLGTHRQGLDDIHHRIWNIALCDVSRMLERWQVFQTSRCICLGYTYYCPDETLNGMRDIALCHVSRKIDN